MHKQEDTKNTKETAQEQNTNEKRTECDHVKKKAAEKKQ
jgi:hypothetical protein